MSHRTSAGQAVMPPPLPAKTHIVAHRGGGNLDVHANMCVAIRSERREDPACHPSPCSGPASRCNTTTRHSERTVIRTTPLGEPIERWLSGHPNKQWKRGDARGPIVTCHCLGSHHCPRGMAPPPCGCRYRIPRSARAQHRRADPAVSLRSSTSAPVRSGRRATAARSGGTEWNSEAREFPA